MIKKRCQFNVRYDHTHVIFVFRCLHKTGGCLPFTPEKCAVIISVAIKLHNMCISQNVPLSAPYCDMGVQDEDTDACSEGDRDGSQQRLRIIQMFT